MFLQVVQQHTVLLGARLHQRRDQFAESICTMLVLLLSNLQSSSTIESEEEDWSTLAILKGQVRAVVASDAEISSDEQVNMVGCEHFTTFSTLKVCRGELSGQKTTCSTGG